MKNARFWTYANGSFAKITLSEGKKITHVSGGPCDEGYHWERNIWRLEAGVVVREIETRSRDCDGRHDTSNVLTCPVELLTATAPDEYRDVPTPKWETEDSEQRDYTAEAAGY